MSVEKIFQSWSHNERIQVLDLALPGIEAFLKDVLQQENLSEKGEGIRRFYVKILENSTGRTETDSSEPFDINKNDLSPLKTPPIQGSRFAYNDEGTSQDKLLDRDDCTKKLQDEKNYPFKNVLEYAAKMLPVARESNDRCIVNYCSSIDVTQEGKISQESATHMPRQDRKGTDSTEESGVFFNTQFRLSGRQEVLNPRHSDTFESTSSRDTFLSDSDFELLEWENDSIVNEDGYCTEDNLENIVQNIQIQPNEFGEIYSGVLYIREQPGWHKRWFTITERCMKCFTHRTDNKMLFEIPLRDAKFVSTDRKRSRMFPITLSIARIKDNITFATTEEKNRQEWIYVINHVIKKLAEEPCSEIPAESKNISFSSLLRSQSQEETHRRSSSSERIPKPSRTNTLEPSRTNTLELQSENLKRKTWHAESEKGFEDVMNQWRVKGEDETTDMDSTISPSLAQEESFKELQECLPDILQRPKSKSWRGDLGNIHLPSSKKDSAGAKAVHNRKNITFSAEVETKPSSSADLTNVPRVKRHGSLANSLTNKAARVRSKLTTSFFKKGKKEQKIPQKSGSQNTMFSGYLVRKKGNTWKNRWCVIKDHSLYCYKEFGAALAELELTLEGCGVTAMPEGEGEKAFMFVLSADKEQLCFAAENDAELEEWLVVLENEAKGADREDDDINIYPTDSIDGHFLTTLSSPDSPQKSHKLLETQTPSLTEEKPKEVTKRTQSFTTYSKEKSQIQGPVKRSSLLGTIAHKLGKQQFSKSKDSADFEKRELQPNEIENLVTADRFKNEGTKSTDLTENGPSLEGILFHRAGDAWLRSKVKLHNHSLDIEPHQEDDPTGDQAFEAKRFRLVNSIVLDCTDTEGPLVMVVKRNIGQPLYLQAETEDDYVTWKEAISSSILITPSTIGRLMSNESGGEGDESCKTATPNSSKISGDSFDRDEVFFREITGNGIQENCEPHPSPRVSIAGDVSSEGSVDDYHKKSRIRVKRAHSAGGIDRLRSLSEGYLINSKKRQSPLRRTISNALTSLDLSPKKRRRKTFGGLGINAALLIGIKYTSCLFFRINKGLWSKRWCVLQQNSLHFFKNSDDISPSSSMKLEGCTVEKTTFKGKKFAFVVKVPSDTTEYCFAAENERELMIWIDLLRAEGDVKGRQENPLMKFDLLNGVLSKIKSEGHIDIVSRRPDVAAVEGEEDDSKNKIAMRKMSKSLVELRKIREAGDKKGLANDSNSNSVSSSSIITQKPTSLQEVLLLLQEQQLMQSMGHQRYIRVKKARGNWKKSAAAVLKDTSSQPESPEFPKKQPEVKEKKDKIETGFQGKPQGVSTGSTHSIDYADALSSCQTSEDYLGKCDKLAEEEKLKALKTETLLRKRRNSLTLEKGVLQKKLEKTQDKKGAVKKLLGKEVVTNKEEIIRDQKRLEEINLKLAHVDQDMLENKNKEAAVMENITALKTNPRPRRSSENHDIARGSTSELTRPKLRESPTGSLSSRDSFEDKNEPYRPSFLESAASLHRKGSKKTGQASLLALEEELQKISPSATRRKKYGSAKRVSSSSEGSFDESFLKADSPITEGRYSASYEKRESLTSIGSAHSQDKVYGWDNVELKRKRHNSGSLPTLAKSELHSVSVSIPTGTGTDETDAASSRVISEHRPSLTTALSQIKDFEEFLEMNRRR